MNGFTYNVVFDSLMTYSVFAFIIPHMMQQTISFQVGLVMFFKKISSCSYCMLSVIIIGLFS